MSRKGEMELQTIIYFILGIIVLLVLGYMFREGITNFFNTLFSLSKDINASRPPIKDLLPQP